MCCLVADKTLLETWLALCRLVTELAWKHAFCSHVPFVIVRDVLLVADKSLLEAWLALCRCA
jgi:hypothetical protein